MSSMLESLKDFLEIEVDQETPNPLHVGEVMCCWTYLTIMDESTVFLQIGLNTTSDDEVKKVLQSSLDQCKVQGDRFRTFMIKEGIHLPETSQPRPLSDPNAVPLGAKLTDEEIINGLSIKTVTAILHCASSSNQAIRNDVGSLFVHAMLEKIKFANSLKEIMRKRGWIKVPPYYYPPGAPSHVQ